MFLATQSMHNIQLIQRFNVFIICINTFDVCIFFRVVQEQILQPFSFLASLDVYDRRCLAFPITAFVIKLSTILYGTIPSSHCNPR